MLLCHPGRSNARQLSSGSRLCTTHMKHSSTTCVAVASVCCQVEQQFKILWADHGDDIARQYAGTGALKSGFTRTGW
jgi:hypothetical protein